MLGVGEEARSVETAPVPMAVVVAEDVASPSDAAEGGLGAIGCSVLRFVASFPVLGADATNDTGMNSPENWLV